MCLIATNEYLVNIISFMFFDFFSPFCTFANGQKYQKYEESLVSKFIDVGNIAKYSICCESTICATVNYGGQYDHPRDEGHVSRMPLPPIYITQEEHKIEFGVRYAGNMIEVMDDDMVLFITTIDANGCVNIPTKIIGTVKLVLLLEKSTYSANINLY